MSNISKVQLVLCWRTFCNQSHKSDPMQRSADGTIKNGIRFHDGLIVESVLTPTDTRNYCFRVFSAKWGWCLDCNSVTARLNAMRNLNLMRFTTVVVAIDQQSRLYHQQRLSNIVFMGMGEPLMNYNNVLKAIDKITHQRDWGCLQSVLPYPLLGFPR